MRLSAERLVILASILVLFGVVRLAHYRTPLVYEEGIMADIFVNHPSGPDYLLQGRVDGHNIYGIPEHPAGLYETIALAGRIGGLVWQKAIFLNDGGARRLRFAFSLFFLLIWGSLAVMVILRYEAPPHWLAVGLLAAVAMVPISVQTSTQLQTDGSVGVLMCGSVALGVLWVSQTRVGRIMPVIFLLLSAAFLGTGKQEWTVLLAFAVVSWLIYICITIPRTRVQEIRSFLFIGAVILCGLSAGNLVSWKYDQQNYMGGLNVMQRIAAVATIATGESPTQRWLEGTKGRWPFVSTILGLLVIVVTMAASRRRSCGPYQVLLILFGSTLFGAYFISSFNPTDPRYFAPSFIVLASVTVSMLGQFLHHEAKSTDVDSTSSMTFESRQAGYRIAVPIITVIVLMLILQGSATLVRTLGSNQNTASDPTSLSKRNCTPLLPTGYAWNRPGVDFIGNGNDREGASMLLKPYGKTLCYP